MFVLEDHAISYICYDDRFRDALVKVSCNTPRLRDVVMKSVCEPRDHAQRRTNASQVYQKNRHNSIVHLTKYAPLELWL